MNDYNNIYGYNTNNIFKDNYPNMYENNTPTYKLDSKTGYIRGNMFENLYNP